MRLESERGPAAALAAALLLASGTGAAGLINGDFSTGFDGWSGEVIACDNLICGTETSTPVGAGETPFASLPNNYGITGGEATLTTSFASDLVYDVALFQIFDVDTLVGGAARVLLHYVLGIDLSDPTDIATAFLTTTDGLLTALLVPGAGPLDITAFAGREVQLTFGLTDFDDGEDRLRISGLAIQQVPLPGTALLLLTGLGLIARRRAQPAPAGGLLRNR